MFLEPRRATSICCFHLSPTSYILKKARSAPTIKMAAELRETKTIRFKTTRAFYERVWGGDDSGGGRIMSRRSQSPSHRAGISYPIRVPPLTPTWFCISISLRLILLDTAECMHAKLGGITHTQMLGSLSNGILCFLTHGRDLAANKMSKRIAQHHTSFFYQQKVLSMTFKCGHIITDNPR